MPYRGTSEALTDTMSGRVQFYLTPVLPAMPLIRSARLVALGITSPQRLPMIPEVPTVAESALRGFTYEGWYGVFAPARTPGLVIDKLSQEIGRAVLSPDQFDKMVRDEVVSRTRIFKAIGAKPN